MLPITTRGAPGMERPILIDGVELSVMPSAVDIDPENLGVLLPTMAGRKREFGPRPYFDGVANNLDPLTFGFPYSALSGTDLEKMKLIIARGNSHLLTVWRYEPVVYTCLAGLKRYYIPSGRRCAAHRYDGLVLDGGGGGAAGITVSTVIYPTIATMNDVALTVTYGEGPTLADPGAGGLVVSREPESAGEAKGYVPILLGDSPDDQDELQVWACWTHEVSLRSARVGVRGAQESHAYVFVEV